MSVKFDLKKGAYVKKGFVGFSYTTFLFNAFVPIFRGDAKGFFILLIAWVVTKSPLYLLKYITDFNWVPESIIVSLFDIRLKYILIADITLSTLLSITISIIWVFIGNWYNRDYTKRLLNDGYVALENDNYSLALLKEYGYLEYIEEEKNDSKKIKLYKNIVETVKDDEKRKIYILITLIILSIAFDWINLYISINKIGDITFFQFLQNSI